MKKTMLFLTTASVSVLVLSGCATIMTGNTQKINLVSSKPQTVEINGTTYQAPGIIELAKTNHDQVATVKECNKKVYLKKEIEPTFWGNVILGGLLGSTTDFASNSMWKYEPSNIDVECK